VQLTGEFKDLVFTREQLVMGDDEYVAIAAEFWPGAQIATDQLTDRDRAYIQAALLVAVDRSEKSGMMFNLFTAFVKGAPSQSLKKIVSGFAKRVAKRWFKAILDDTPKISAVGKTAVQYGAFLTEWRLRVGLDDPNELTSFLAAR
jgi:hypothetical protein